MANGFIDGVGYPMNGGLSAGLSNGMALAKERERLATKRGLASGFTQYMNAQDDAGKRAALSQMAQYDPNTAFNLMKYEQELAIRDKMTPYQQATLDLQRKQFERGEQLTPYQQAQLDIQRQQIANQGKMNEYQTWQKEEALRKEQEAKEKEKLLGDALYRYQTAPDEETKKVALAEVYKASPEFAKEILKKKKEAELSGGYRQYLVEKAFDTNTPEEQRKLYLGMAQSLAHDPYLKGAETYEGAIGKQYAEAGQPYTYGNGQPMQAQPVQAQPIQERQIPTAAQLAADKKRAEKEVERSIEPEIREANKVAEERAKYNAEINQKRENLERNIQSLREMTDELIDLSDKATYTQVGQWRDDFLRQTGLPMSEGGIAREKYNQIVRNELLPKLRETFGGQLSDGERQALLSTLGDLNLSPPEKKAAVRAFMEAKERQLKSYYDNGNQTEVQIQQEKNKDPLGIRR